MRRAILYGLILALLIFVLKLIEYKFLVRDLSIEFYLGTIVVLFTILGIWSGLKLTTRKKIIVNVPSTPFIINEGNLKSLGITRREHEVLELMATGLSNQEIADRLLVSLNTIKTHTSGLFLKMEVKRRTQAIQKGKDLRLIP